ncbi:MAG: 3-oxoacyl-ACP synthase III family protein [Flavicella sp.]
MPIQSVIIGTGSYIPSVIVKNEDFLNHSFLQEDGTHFASDTPIIIKKFEKITGIKERRYALDHQNASDLAVIAAKNAIKSAKIEKNNIDYILLAHNFGDVSKGSIQGDMLPSLASKVKHKLKIQNPNCVALDIVFGCPGWLQGMIQATAFIQSGMAKTILVIGTETLSRVIDDYDRDSMIYADGAGATLLQAKESTSITGVLSHAAQTFSEEELGYLFSGKSYHKELTLHCNYLKMQGRKIYEFALTHVSNAMKAAWDKSEVPISKLSKILIHQANEKMDEAIVKRFYSLYELNMPDSCMPMCIEKLGNSSVATIPTLLDLILNNSLSPHSISKGDIVLFASVGAGMNINAMVYQF